MYYLAISKDIKGLAAQGYTVEETVEIARNLVIDLMKLGENKNRKNKVTLRKIPENFYYPFK